MRIRVHNIVVNLDESGIITRFCMEEPVPEMASDALGLRFAGWFIARAANIQLVTFDWACDALDSVAPISRPDVEAIVNLPGQVAGFEAVVPLVGVSGEIRVDVMLHFEGGAICAGSVFVTVEPLRLDCGLARMPILLTSGGRVGSTLAMNLISSHPSVVTQRTFPYEDRSALDW